MSFKFPLATVLQVRIIREEREERMLQQILYEIAQATHLLHDVDTRLSQVDGHRLSEVHKQVNGLHVHSSYGEIAALQQTRAEITAHINKLEELRQRQLNAYDTARRDREMLSDMREEQRDAYWADVAKREQKTLDDNFGARHSRTR